MGGLGIYLHSRNQEELWNSLRRLGDKVFTDIDFMSRFTQCPEILKFFQARGYRPPTRTMFYDQARKRLIFYGSAIPMIDVFFDRLEMCHIIDFRDRLNTDYPTIPPAELLLEKLQIVRINEKDIKDAIVLLRAHELSDSDQDVVNAKHISQILSSDWGFYYTATMNLGKIRDSLRNYQALSDDDGRDIQGKIDRLLERVRNEPKTMAWKIRERIGTRKKWYTDVEEIS